MNLTLAELAVRCGCAVSSDPDTLIWCATSIEMARPGALVFAVDEGLLAQAEASDASAMVIPEASREPSKPSMRAENVRLSWAKALEVLYPKVPPPPGVHATAVVHPTALVDVTASIGAHCSIGAGSQVQEQCALGVGVVIGDGVTIGKGTTLHAHVVIGDGCIIGERNLIYPGAVVGADGFGFAREGKRYYRIPQIGIVRTGSDVEIGANTTVDRAALGETYLGDGVKIDNLVQVGHNVTIGSNTVIASQVGIAGSVQIGDGVAMGGQAGIADHVTIGEGATLTGRAGVIGSVSAGQIVMGFPARPRREFLRSTAALARLPELLRSLGGKDKSPDPSTHNSTPETGD